MIMKRLLLVGCIFLTGLFAGAQVANKIGAAINVFNHDEQLQYATVALYVVDASTGATVFDQNSRLGMAPASTEKIITAATAFDILGKDFQYETKFGIVNTPAGKSLYIEPAGDPTMGSWRWDNTRELVILDQIKAAIQNKHVTKLQSVIINTGKWKDETIPDGWIWQDLGNYYGAAAQPLNWRENQFDLILQSGNTMGSTVNIVKTNPQLYHYKIVSKATAAAASSGDNTYLYYPSMGNNYGVITGTIPLGQKAFTVSGSFYNPMDQFVNTLITYLQGTVNFMNSQPTPSRQKYNDPDWFYTYTSPDLSAMVYWFLRKSINLYGEAFLKTIALQSTGTAGIDEGIDFIQRYWKTKNIDADELHLYDGSGLSPQNRITPHAQVSILQYARQQSWFPQYYEAFPLYNDMKMKSGTINRVKGFTGYQQSKDGKEYIFSFLVNNYNGSEYSLIRKMYKVLDNLK